MGKVVGCGFCPELADITGEHLWPNWFAKRIGRRKVVVRQGLDDGTFEYKQKWALNERAYVVCAKCNNGWMSVLENKAKKVTNAMALYGSSRVLQAEDIALIAANTFKSAIVADLMHDTRPPFFSLLQRRKFAATLNIPDNVQMWLASTVSQRGVFASYYFTTKAGTARGFEFNVFTHGLGHLLVQVITVRWKTKSQRRHGPPLWLTQSPEWDPASIPFWPSGGNPIAWPPAEHFSDDIADEFVHRWKRLIRGPSFPAF